MYANMKLLIFFILFSGLEVRSQFFLSELTGSGDGPSESSTYSRLPLLDDNGEISTSMSNVDGIEKIEETEVNLITEMFPIDNVTESTTAPINNYFTENETRLITFTNIISSGTETENTAATNTTFIVFEEQTEGYDMITTQLTDSTGDSELITSSSTTSTGGTTVYLDTTIEDITTTEIPTTAKTTKKPIKTDAAEIVEDIKTEPKITIDKSPSTLVPVSTRPMTEDTGKPCTFIDVTFQCDTDVICYGEGEVDCTDNEEMDSDETHFVDEMPPPVAEFDDYIAEGKTSETYPIRRIESILKKTDLFKIFPQITTDDVSEEESGDLITTFRPLYSEEESGDLITTFRPLFSEEESGDLITTFRPLFNETVPVHHESLDDEYSTTNDITTSGYLLGDILDGGRTVENGDEVSSSSSTKTDFTENVDGVLLQQNEKLITEIHELGTEMPVTTDESTFDQQNANYETSPEITASTLDVITPDVFEKTSTVNDANSDHKEEAELTRTKRDKSADSPNGYQISNYKVSELGSSKKLKGKSCKLTGNLVCYPRPTQASCSGKTFCKVAPQTVETVEKPNLKKGQNTWTIVFIAVIAVFATLTFGCIGFFIFTSYKKLKVQPQNGVTTLNYFNSTQP